MAHNKTLRSAVRRALYASALAGAASAAWTSAQAQSEVTLEEIVVTGSAIVRDDLNSALPIQIITEDQITRRGIKNAADLIENIPAMQGFITESDTVGGSGGGIRTANLRAIGDQYTLSLLNGRRMAPADSGSSIDLSNIPLAAVEQVHVLTDGASSLYGSDAIAGVVNFVLKDQVDETTISLRTDRPAQSGGKHQALDIVTGFDGDKGSVVLSFSHEDQDQLAAADRDFAKTGFVFFDHGGQQLYFQNSSANSIPGNAFVYTANYDDFVTGFNPDALANGGVCAEHTTPDDLTCRFDYTSTLEVLPESSRDSFSLNGRINFSDNLEGFATLLASQFEMTARIAPYPTGEIPLPFNSALVQNEVLPYLTPAELALAGEVTGTWRALPAGNRTTRYDTDSTNLTLGLNGSAGDWNYTVALTQAQTKIVQDYPTGWLLLDEFVNAASSGAFNIFAKAEDFTDADMAALAPTIYHGNWDTAKNDMTVVEAQASKPLFDMGGGDATLAVGFDYRTTNYDRAISQANANEDLLFLSKDTPYELDRDQYGLYAELLLPITDSFQTTLSARHDDISAVSDKLNGGDIDQGDKDTTYKISALWNTTDTIAFRASYGTGFKAPSMREIGEPVSEFGVTSGTFACPFASGDPLAQYCRPQEAQYDVYRQGSGLLKFEKSTQYTLGMVFTPSNSLSATIDYWNIELKDLVQRLTEQQIFANPDLYRIWFTTKTNLATGQEFLAIIQAAVNAGSRENEGIDYALNKQFDLGDSMLGFGLQGTYVMKSLSSLTGSSLGQFGNDDSVVFRNIINFNVDFDHGDFSHTFYVTYHSGYRDQEQEVEIVGTGAPLGQGPTTLVKLDVPSYSLANYMLRYDGFLNNRLGLSFGISNLLDEEPPLSLRTSGAGHQVGWDPRFTDAYGRTYYLQAQFAF
jgi:iron complex outermembrane recepter protein